MRGRLTLGRFLRYVWASPTTAVGLVMVILTLFTGGYVRILGGVIEAHGGFARWWLRHAVPMRGGAFAMAIGHVVIGRDEYALDSTREHELVHVRQCERWGPFFIPAYLLASAWQVVRGRRAYRDNAFEREAFAAGEGPL